MIRALGLLACLLAWPASATTVFLTTADVSPWIVPGGVSSVQAECIGGGATGGNPGLSPASIGGGGAGAYGKTLVIPVSGTAPFQVGAGSVANTAANGQDTWFSASGTVQGGKGFTATGTLTGGAGGTGVGDTTFSGGSGANGLAAIGGGGGGAAGPFGAGASGSGATGGQGDNTHGGAGGTTNTSGQAGTEIDATHGSGGGGGGGTGAGGGNGGLYGAGGGGSDLAGDGSGAGRNGLIWLTYTAGSTHPHTMTTLGVGSIEPEQSHPVNDNRVLDQLILSSR